MTQFSSAIRNLLERLRPDLFHLAALGELVASVIESGFSSISLDRIASSISSSSLFNSPGQIEDSVSQTLPDLPSLLETLHAAHDLVATQADTSSRESLLEQNRPFILYKNRLYSRRSFQIETELLRRLSTHKDSISILPCTAEMENPFNTFLTSLLHSPSTSFPVSLIAASYASLDALTRHLPSALDISGYVLNEVLGYSSRIKNYHLEYAKPIQKGTLLIEIAAPMTAEALAKILRIEPPDISIVFFSSPETFSTPESTHLFESLFALFSKVSPESFHLDPERENLRQAFLGSDLRTLLSFANAPDDSPVHLDLFPDKQLGLPSLPSDDSIVLTPYTHGDWGAFAISALLRSRTVCHPLFIVDKAPADAPLHRNDIGLLKDGIFYRKEVKYSINDSILLSPANALSFDRMVKYTKIHIVIPPTCALPSTLSRYILLRASECAQKRLTIHATREALDAILHPSPFEGVPFDLTELSDV